jgi:drug/metabolite transporter (DMT)-like permease
VCGLLIGFAGILTLVWPELTVGGDVGSQFAGGVIALQIACIGWSLGSAYSKHAARRESAAGPAAANKSSLGGSALQMFFGGAMMLAIGTMRGEWSALWFTPRSAAALAYLTVFGSIVGYSAYMHALKHLPVSTVSLYAYVNPVIAVVLGALILGEPLGPRVAFGAMLVLSGVAIVRVGPRAQWSGLRAVQGLRPKARQP